MQGSKYLKAFKEGAAGSYYKLSGDFLLVERIPAEEQKTAGGIILNAAPSTQIGSIGANLPTFVHVLAVGEGFYNEDGEDVPLTTKPGDILLVGQQSVKWFPVLPGFAKYEPFSVGISSEQETQLKFEGIEGYDGWINALNRGIETDVAK